MSLDPRAPLVLDTRELDRRPGSQRTVDRTAPAPSDLGIAVLGVTPGSSVELELRLEAVMEGVLLSGTACATLAGECVRCLEEITDEVVADLQELFAYEGSSTARTAGEDEAGRLEGDLLDLEPVLRDALVLALPFRPLCREDCPGLCPECGDRLADDPDHQHREVTDPRWAALRELAEPKQASRR